jgi:hypothetical protein
MKAKMRRTTLVLALFVSLGFIFLGGLLGLAPAAQAAAPPLQTPNPQTFSITDTLANSWQDVLARTPLPYTAPLPEPVAGPFDGFYAKIDPAWPQWWICRRCADYRPAGGIWKLQFEQGVMRIYYDITRWSSLASFTVSGNRLTLFNDPYCGEVGEYSWTLADGHLKLKTISDACAFGLRARTLTQQAWPACLPPDSATGVAASPGCVDEPSIPAAPAPAALPVTVTVYGGDSRFFETPPNVLVFANSPLRAERENIDLTYHPESIPFGLNRVIWWSGDWIEVSTERPFTAMGVQFMGDPYQGWARVLFDGVEVWRGDTAAIWSKHGRHGGYIEISGFAPGPHTLRAESLGSDYHPIQVASFGFSEQSGVEQKK